VSAYSLPAPGQDGSEHVGAVREEPVCEECGAESGVRYDRGLDRMLCERCIWAPLNEPDDADIIGGAP
jgi:hypothetical protein